MPAPPSSAFAAAERPRPTSLQLACWKKQEVKKGKYSSSRSGGVKLTEKSKNSKSPVKAPSDLYKRAKV